MQDKLSGRKPGQKHYVRWMPRGVALVCVCLCILLLSLFCFNKRAIVSTIQIILHLLHRVCSPDVLCLVCVIVSL